jgi:hypothetical protein
MSPEIDKSVSKDKQVKALVYLRRKWVEDTGAGEMFRSANENADRAMLVVPVTHFDISDRQFVEIVFWPRALANHPIQSVKAFVPKEEIALIVELKSPETLSVLGFKSDPHG